MKSVICFLALVSVVLALPQGQQPQSRLLRQGGGNQQQSLDPHHQQSLDPHQQQGGAAPAPAGPAQGGAAAPHPRAPAQPVLGPNFFGPGLNNPVAFPTNPQQVRVAQEVFKTNPNLRALVNVNGEIEFTNQFGQEVEVVDSFGRNPLEPLDPEEVFEQQLKQARLQARIQAQQQLLRSLQGGFAGGARGAGGAGGAGGARGAGAAGAAGGNNFQQFGGFAGLEAFEGLEELAELRALGGLQGGAQNAGNRFFVN